jgi:hypothetical protein
VTEAEWLISGLSAAATVVSADRSAGALRLAPSRLPVSGGTGGCCSGRDVPFS